MLMRTWNVIEVLKPEPSSVRQQLNEEPQMDHLLVYSFFLEWFCYIRSYCVCSGPSAFRECSAHCVALCSRVMCCFCFYCWESLDPPPLQKNKQTNKQTINRLSNAIAIFLLEDSTKKENGSWPLYYFFSPKKFIYNSSLLTVAVGWQTSQSNGFRSKNIHVVALRKTLLERRLIFLSFEGNMMVVE